MPGRLDFGGHQVDVLEMLGQWYDSNYRYIKARSTNGPKPVRALREIGLDADMPADEPTTEGIIAAMRRHDFGGHHVGVQLYPRNPNLRLMDFIEAAGAVPDPVLPYVYVSEADDSQVLAIINGMARGQFDAIAFTSAPQVRRLRDVAYATGREAELLQGFKRIVVAAVGPIVASELESFGVQVSIMPSGGTFFMKPLVRKLAAALTKDGKAGAA
jgi:uroporphyrinogen-III synthase